jgi:hypothetical protein
MYFINSIMLTNMFNYHFIIIGARYFFVYIFIKITQKYVTGNSVHIKSEVQNKLCAIFFMQVIMTY